MYVCHILLIPYHISFNLYMPTSNSFDTISTFFALISAYECDSVPAKPKGILFLIFTIAHASRPMSPYINSTPWIRHRLYCLLQRIRKIADSGH